MSRKNIDTINGNLQIKTIINRLNTALSEEWLAYYQYWTAAQSVVGPRKTDVRDKFMQHAGQELDHAILLCQRIVHLGGQPVLTPQNWANISRCPTYRTHALFEIENLLKTIRTTEECAMIRYQEIAELTEHIDISTNNIAKRILAEEADHEQNIQDFLDDLAHMKKYMGKWPGLSQRKRCATPM